MPCLLSVAGLLPGCLIRARRCRWRRLCESLWSRNRMGRCYSRSDIGTRAFARSGIVVVAAVGRDGKAALWRRCRGPRKQIGKSDRGSNDCGLRENLTTCILVYSGLTRHWETALLQAETGQRNNISILSATSSAIEPRSAEGKRR